MNQDIIDADPVVQYRRLQGLKAWGWLSYALHLIVAVAAVIPGAQVSVAVLLVALIIDLIKRSDARGTWHESHFSWRLRSVIWAMIWYVVTFPFFLLGLFLFNPAWVVVSLWFLYRIVRGALAMSKEQALHG